VVLIPIVKAGLATAVVAGSAYIAAHWSDIKTSVVESRRMPTARLRELWERLHGKPWPTDANGKPQDADHDVPLADGGADTPDNVTPRPHDDHVQRHKDNGDFKRWGGRRTGQDRPPEPPKEQSSEQPKENPQV
jgi:hypothetical protein